MLLHLYILHMFKVYNLCCGIVGGCNVKDFLMFIHVLETTREKGVIVVVALVDDIVATNEERHGFLQVKKVM